MEERFLHCAIYPNAGFYLSMLNCSASGKKRGGDYHVRKAKCLLGFTVLLRLLFFQISIHPIIVNLLKSKHRIGLAIWRV